MNFEVLKKSHLKRNIIIGVVAVLIISAIILNFTRARYRVTESIPLVNGTINYSLADLNAVAIYINGDSGYNKSDTVPESGYVLNEEESYCTIDGERDDTISLSYNVDTKSLSVTPMTTRGTKCYLYFDTEKTLNNIILANSKVNEGTPNFSQIATTDEGIYKTEDNLGISYYFRGAVTNNYVQFAGFYWRIIRINGDGSIRIIYDGTKAHVNGESSNDRQTGTSAYSSSYDHSYYVGYTYQVNVQRPNNASSGTASTIKGVLDNWYQSNIAGKGLDNQVINTSGFCNDRNTASGEGWSDYRYGSFYYAAYDRVYRSTQPTLQCSNINDLYNTKVGLITVDEVRLAGGTTENNTNYYLYIGLNYWTMSPYQFYYGVSRVFQVESGSIDEYDVHNIRGVRPVINLRADVTIFSGDGTASNPYVIS